MFAGLSEQCDEDAVLTGTINNKAVTCRKESVGSGQDSVQRRP